MKIIFLFSVISFFIACAPTAKQNAVSEPRPGSKKLVSQEETFQSHETQKSKQIVKENENQNTEILPPIPLQTDTLTELKQEEPKRTDPYVEIQKIVLNVFQNTDSLIAEGNLDSAKIYIDKLLVLNPLWESWMKLASEKAEQIAKENVSVSEKLKPLMVEIINANATNAPYYSVKILIDSLMTFDIKDSVLSFAKKQQEIAFEKNFKKVKKEKLTIQSDAETSGNFILADSLAKILILKNRDFADTLKLSSWHNQIKELARMQANSESYFKTHNPETIFQKAETLQAKEEFLKAKVLYQKLLVSPLSKKAKESLDTMALTVCQKARKNASKFYTQFKKENKNFSLLNKAIETLSFCSENFSTYPEGIKATEDKELLLKELNNGL